MRLWVRLRILFLAVVMTFPVLAVNVSVTLAAPSYEHPFWCGRTYYGTTRPNHGWGLDIAHTTAFRVDGDEVMASASGMVVEVVIENGEVWINHSGGGFNQGYETVYAHMREVQVQVGDPVTTGQLLGYADNVGFSTDPHLHYGQLFNGAEQQVHFYGQPYQYQGNVDNRGPDFASQHCIAATATDLAGANFRGAIDWMYAFDYTLGCGGTQFCPSSPLLREQVASFLARTLRLPATTTDYFSDDQGTVHESDINRIAAAGITTGCGNGQFCPKGTVDRLHLAVLLGRALAANLEPNPPDYFTDDENTGEQEVWINRLAHAGITTGCGGSSYCPTMTVTRDMAAAFFFRAQDHRPWPSS